MPLFETGDLEMFESFHLHEFGPNRVVIGDIQHCWGLIATRRCYYCFRLSGPHSPADKIAVF